MQRQKGTSQTAILPAIRMYPAELEHVRQCAKDAGLSLSEYVRSRLTPQPVPTFEAYKSYSVPESLAPAPPPISILIDSSQRGRSSLPTPELSSQIPIPSVSKPLHGSAFINDTIARKVGHEPGCTCTFCARMRTVLSTSKQDKPKAVRKR